MRFLSCPTAEDRCQTQPLSGDRRHVDVCVQTCCHEYVYMTDPTAQTRSAAKFSSS